MNAHTAKREQRMQWLALAWLLLLGSMALVGPFGLLSWSEQASLLDQRRAQITALQAERAVLVNRVDLLDPRNVDADFASELTRGNLNVAHPDEFVVDLAEQP